MTDCEITEILPDYINKKLTQKQNFEVINHLAICQNCRNEVAWLIKIKNSEQLKMEDVPQNIFNSAFQQLPQESHTLYTVINSYFEAFKITQDAMIIVNKTIQLAQQAI